MKLTEQGKSFQEDVESKIVELTLRLKLKKLVKTTKFRDNMRICNTILEDVDVIGTSELYWVEMFFEM